MVYTVRDAMFIDTSRLVLAGARGETLRGHFIGERKNGTVGSEEREVPPSSDAPLGDPVFRERKMITKYDVAEDPRFAGVRDSCGRRFEEQGAVAIENADLAEQKKLDVAPALCSYGPVVRYSCLHGSFRFSRGK